MASIYEFSSGAGQVDQEAANRAMSRAILFPAIGWRAVLSTLVIAWLLGRRGSVLRSVGLSVRKLWLDILIGLGVFAGIALATVLISLLINILFPDLAGDFEENAKRIKEAVPRASLPVFAAISLGIGYYEELIFRGFLMPRLRRASGSWVVGVLGNSAIFVPLHLMDQTAVALLAVGALSLTFSLVTIWRHSIWPAVLAHALFDFMMFVNLFYVIGDA